MDPLVSAIMLVTYPRRAEMIAQACAAFRWQTYPRLEMVVVNDGEPLISLDPRVVVVQAPPGLTIGEKRNLGLNAARGDLVATWDDDDISFPERISLHVQQLRENGSRSHRSSRMWVSDKGLQIIGLLTDLCLPTSLIDRGRCCFVGGYPAISYLEDVELDARLALRRIARTSSTTPVYVHRRHNANASSQYSAQTVDSLARDADRSDPAAIAAVQRRLDMLLAQPQRPLLATSQGDPLMYTPPIQPSGQTALPDAPSTALETPAPAATTGTDRIAASIENGVRQLGPLLANTVLPILQRDRELQRTVGAAAGQAAARELKPVLWFLAGTLAAGVLVYWTRPRREPPPPPPPSPWERRPRQVSEA